jgi:SAM-dependent methyltransferase
MAPEERPVGPVERGAEPDPPDGGRDPSRFLESRLERYAELDRANLPYLDWQLEAFRPHLGRRVLEIGCGVGGIVELLGPRELVYGIDVEADVLEYARRRFRARPECRFACADFGTLAPERLAELRAQRFDTVIAVNVLEHIRDDVGALQTVESLLVPGGVLALLVPAHPWLYGPYDELDGHFRRYSKAYLRAILRHTGLRERRMRYFNALGAVGWFVQYRLLRRPAHGTGHFGLMNRAIPLLRPLERALPPPFGLSLVAVLERPAAPGAARQGEAPPRRPAGGPGGPCPQR